MILVTNNDTGEQHTATNVNDEIGARYVETVKNGTKEFDIYASYGRFRVVQKKDKDVTYICELEDFAIMVLDEVEKAIKELGNKDLNELDNVRTCEQITAVDYEESTDPNNYDVNAKSKNNAFDYGTLFYDNDQKAWVLWPNELDDGVTYWGSLQETEKALTAELTAL